MKTQELIHATKVKQTPKHATEADKSIGNGKHMNDRKAMDSYGSGACTSQYREGGSQVWGKKMCGLAMGKRGEPILGFSLKLFWGKYPIEMTYHPKEANMSWNQ